MIAVRRAAAALAAMMFCGLSPAVPAADAETYDRVSLAADAGREVANDRMQAVAGVLIQGQDTAWLAREVNSVMTWAMQQADAMEGVQAETVEYRTEPVYREGKVRGWQASYALRLTSRRFDALNELLGRLQERLQLRSVSFDVSPERRKTVENELITEALAAFGERAALIADSLGRSGYRIVSLDVSTSGDRPHPVARMAAEMAQPPMAEGVSRIEARVSGTIQLR